MNNNHHGGNFFNGLVVGAAIGAGLFFLLGTKSGKKVVKAISENGFDNIEGIMGALGSLGCDCEGECNCEDCTCENAKGNKSINASGEAADKPRLSLHKRFFKGIKKS